jgi:hypothetical protein
VKSGITIDGWTLIMKIKGADGNDGNGAWNLLTYDSPWWTNKGVLNEESEDLSPANAKFKEFNEMQGALFFFWGHDFSEKGSVLEDSY